MLRNPCFLVSFSLVSAIAGLPAEIEPTRLGEEHQEAARHLGNENWDRAAEAYRAILARSPEDSLAPNARLGVARAMVAAGKHHEALVELRAVLSMIDRRVAGNGPGAPQPEDAWRHTLQREIGSVYEAREDYGNAIAAYREAIKVIAGDQTVADWRARGAIDLARCLVRSGRPGEAIELLTRKLSELDGSEFAGMRALQKATLGRHYFEMGERDWAVTLLEQIRHDPELDPQQYGAAEALVEGKQWEPPVTGKMRTRKGPGYLAIESAGRYELRLALRPPGGNPSGKRPAGSIAGWYNLEDDPFKTTNLAGPGPPGLLSLELVDLPRGEREDPEIEVLEENEVRVRTRTRRLDWPFEIVDYTFYPTGQIFIAAKLDLQTEESSRRLNEAGLVTATNARLNWRTAVDGASRMSGEGKGLFETPFVLAHSNPTPSVQRSMPDDLLVISSSPNRSRALINEEEPLQWCRSSLRLGCDPKVGSQRFAIQMRVCPRTIDSFSIAKPYADDYRRPARLKVLRGSIGRDDPGDLNRDGFDESEGCYVVRDTDAVTLAAGDLARHQPVVKFLGSRVDGIPGLTVNGKPAAASAYNLARTGTDSFVMQWLGVLEAGKEIDFALK